MGTVAPATSQEPQEDPPNILIILTDDQRWDALSTMPETMRLFAQDGVSFPNAFATTPLCCPSRASILTGRYSHNHGVKKNTQADRLDVRSTIPRYLSEAGYKTALVGKYLQSLPLSQNPAFFDRWAMTKFGYADRRFNLDGVLKMIHEYFTDFMRDKTIAFLNDFERVDDRPWFIFLAPTAPHRPAVPRADHVDAEVPPLSPNVAMSEADRSDKPPFVQQRNYSFSAAESVYREQLQTLMSADEMVAQVFETLEDLDEADNTLAFFLSDNGYLLAEHGLVGKRLPYLPSAKIPMFARWPGSLPAGQVDERLVANIDLLPTILEAVGTTADPAFPVDGRSILDETARAQLLLEEYGNKGYPDWASLVSLDRQYIEYYPRGSSSAEFAEYYDLGADPWQIDNLIPTGLPLTHPGAIQSSLELSTVKDCSGVDCP